MAAPRLTLYRADGACSVVPHSILLHYGIPFTPVTMESGPNRKSAGMRYVAADGSLSHEDYLAINPEGYVPALVVGEGEAVQPTIIAEMPAVLTYLASLTPNAKLLGDEPLQQAQVVSWMAWISGTLHATGVSVYFLQGRVVDDEHAFPGVKRKAHDIIEKSFSRIEGSLTGRKFADGRGLTAVDFNLYPFWRWAKMCGLDLGRYPRYAAHMKMIEGLEGVRKALVAEGLTPCFE